MDDQHKTKAQLLAELEQIRNRVDELEQVEEALRESEEKYRTIVENVSDQIIHMNKYGTIIYANDKEAIFGRKPEEIIGKNFTALDYFNVNDIPKYLKLFKDVITGKKTLDKLELEIKHKDGHIIPIEVSTTLIKKNGRAQGFMCLVRDITERKRAEEALKDSEERFRAVVQSAKDSIILIDNEGIVHAWNKAADVLFQHNESDVIGKELCQIIVPERYHKSFKSGFEHFKTTGKGAIIGKTLELTALRKDSVEFPIEMSLSAIKLREQWHAIGIIRDITKRKQAEAELEATQEQLRNLSAHLQSAREEDRSMIAREIHDELSQSLTALNLGILELKDTLPADQISLIEKATLMTEYVDTIALTVNRIATRLRPALLDELGLVDAIEWEIEQFENRTGIKCELTVDPEEMVVDQDRSTAIYRIVQEALTNIARHAQATRGAVTLKMSGGKLYLSITDNGIGIAEDQVLYPKSLGIIGMRERVLSVGGNFEINGIKKKGTKIMVIIPVENES